MLNAVILAVIQELTEKEFDALLPLAPPEKQERIKRFRLFRDARNCLLGDILARDEISRVAGINRKRLKFSLNAYGKPFLADNPDIHFNISHTDNHVACVVSDKPVGIDIEHVRPVGLNIAKRFFTLDELAYVVAGGRDFHFYEIWTKKESRIKLEGKGLHKALPSFSVLDPDEEERFFYYRVFQEDETVCHVCSEQKARPSVNVLDIAGFVRYIKQESND